jgi:hypothetical protein
MKKIPQRLAGKRAIWYLLILISLNFLGCAGVGQNVPAQNRILFDEKETSHGRFNKEGLTVDYSYRLAGGNITLDGQVYYTQSLDSLDVRLLFLDEGGNVLRQNIVYFSGYRVFRSWKSERTFHETLVVPQEAVGISFNYYAQPRTGQK